MSYKDKPQIRLYKYINSAFTLIAIIDDCQDLSFEHNLYSAGQFTITINYNIPNALLFERGLFVQFGNNPYDFGEIYSIQDAIGQDGKGSQIRTITGYDARYILKRRVIKNMNSNGLWTMTAKGELCLRNLIKDQCGTGAEAKRQLPINNVIPSTESAIGKEYSVSEQFSNLYEVCKTIATQSEIGWRIAFDGELTLEVYEGQNLSGIVKFDTNYESLANGDFSDSSESYTNAIYIGGKGQNDDRDIYEGEDGSPNGLDRFESWDNQSQMTTESEYETEAISMLTQYGQTLTMQGNGLAKCPYIFREQYNIGDIITVSFSGKSANAQILSVTEHWAWGSYDIQFSFGKPQNNLADQLQLILKQIQKASNKTNSTDSVRWYTIPTDTEMPKADVTYDTIGFIGDVGSGATFTLYLDNEKTGAKTYHVWFKQLAGSGKLTLTTGKSGAVDLSFGVGTYVAIISVDEAGNIVNVASTPTDVIQSGNNQPITSDGVANYTPSHATNSDYATNAGSATNADYATNAGHATSADSATNAGNADTLDGLDSLVFMHHRISDDVGTSVQLQNAIVNNGSAGPCCGSYEITDGPWGNVWYNYIFVPHRTGIGQDSYLYGTLIVFQMTGNDGYMAIKHYINGSWYEWKGIHAESANTATNATNATNAGNADTVDGYHASEGAYGSTVGVRNAYGYFNATIFHDEWSEENINNYSNPKLIFKGNNDGYLRNTDPSYVSVGHASNSSKLEDKTWRETALSGLYITDDTTSLSSSSYTFSPSAPAGSAELAVGSTVKVTFANALQSSSAIISVNFNYGGRNGQIVSARQNSLVGLVSHLFQGGQYSAQYPNKVWDSYTTLELMWTGSYWLVMGDAILCSYFSSDANYIIKANGLITQWKSSINAHDYNWDFSIYFSNTDYAVTNNLWIDGFCQISVSKYTSRCEYRCIGRHCDAGGVTAIGY